MSIAATLGLKGSQRIVFEELERVLEELETTVRFLPCK